MSISAPRNEEGLREAAKYWLLYISIMDAYWEGITCLWDSLEITEVPLQVLPCPVHIRSSVSCIYFETLAMGTACSLVPFLNWFCTVMQWHIFKIWPEPHMKDWNNQFAMAKCSSVMAWRKVTQHEQHHWEDRRKWSLDCAHCTFFHLS